ncbi:MAG: hypothetical protein IIW08_05095 [Clostridia bacterium]|nr:hypothetical protein [Clostridia bacterium]
MLSVLLIAFMILLYSFQTLFCRLYNDVYPGREETAPFVYNVFYGVFVSVVTLAMEGFHISASPETVLYGLLNSVVLFTYNIMVIKATGAGSYAIANLSLLAGGILIPLAQSVVFYRVPLNFMQYAGVVIMLLSFLFLNADGLFTGKKDKAEKKPKKRSLFPVFCALLFLANGAYGSLFNAQQESMKINAAQSAGVSVQEFDGEYDTERGEMIILTFLPTAVMGLCLVGAQNGRNTLSQFRQTKKSALYLFLCCASAALAINLLVYVMTLVNVPVLYTVENGGVLVLSVLYATWLFKEKITPFKAVGLLLALVSLVLLGAATA